MTECQKESDRDSTAEMDKNFTAVEINGGCLSLPLENHVKSSTLQVFPLTTDFSFDELKEHLSQ